MPNINVKEIQNVSKSALVQHGSDDWVAAHVAEAIAASESVGNRICGLYYLESYCEQLISGPKSVVRNNSPDNKAHRFYSQRSPRRQ